MDKELEAFTGKPLSRWLRITALVLGVMMLSFGMSSLLMRGGIRETLVLMFTGSLTIYISGFQKRLVMDGSGVTHTASFWGFRRTQTVSWQEITDARLILNRGRRMYLLLHGSKKIWPLTYHLLQKQEVLDLLHEHLADSDIKIEE